MAPCAGTDLSVHVPPSGPGEPPHGAQLLRAERDGEQLYLIDTDGSRWRVHDVAFGPPLAAPFKRRRLALGDPRATYRWFVAPDGLQRCYQWPQGSPANRSLKAATLAQQLRASEYGGRMTPAPPVSDPR
jgi:hypothetical protein